MNKYLVTKMIKLADALDREGRVEEASLVDKILERETDMIRVASLNMIDARKNADIKNMSPDDMEIEIPEDEYDMLAKIYESLGQSLNN